MRLYCSCNFCKSKIHLAASAQTRQQLANNIGQYFTVNCFSCQAKNQMTVNSVFAEVSHDKTPYTTTGGGGLIGVVAGPIGVVIGLIAGGVVGGVALTRDKEAVRRFNNSWF